MVKNTKTLAEGYHGTIIENLEKGLNREARVYDKLKIEEAANPDELDLTDVPKHAITLAYGLASKTGGNSLESEKDAMRVRLLYGRRINASAMQVQKVMETPVPELFSGYSLDAFKDITEEFFNVLG